MTNEHWASEADAQCSSVGGSPTDAAAELRRRFDGRVDRVAVYAPYALADEALAEVVSAFRG